VNGMMRGVVTWKKASLLLWSEGHCCVFETEGDSDLLFGERGIRESGMDGEGLTEKSETEVAVEKLGIIRLRNN
jgi:hypothetical protein